MTNTKKYHFIRFIRVPKLFWIGFLCMAGLSVRAQENPLTVVANSKGAPAELKMTELKSVLKGEKQRWNNGTRVVIVLMKTTTSIGKTMSKKVYNMSADEVKSFWFKLNFAGKADVPKFCNTVEELMSYVSENPGAIGILDKLNSDTPDVKTIAVDGKKSF